MYKIKITVVAPIGEFTGYGSEEAVTREQVNLAIDLIKSKINILTYLILYASDGTQTLLNESILKQSVIKLRIESFLVWSVLR